MVLLGPPDQGPFTPVAVWPDAKLNMKHLTGAAERSLKERRGILVETDNLSQDKPFPETHQIAYPLEVAGKLQGVVVLGVDQPDKKEVQHIMRQLHWGAAWLEVLVRRNEALEATEVNARLQKVLDLIASAVEHEDFQAAAMALVTRMATSLECDRVSLGFIGRRHVRVAAMSHTADFGKQTNLVRSIGAAMDEAVDQQSSIVYPQQPDDGTPFVTRVHAELDRQHGSGAVCTVPMRIKGKPLGAITLERTAQRPFDPKTVELCEMVAALAGPILDTKRAEQRWLIRKAATSFARQLERLFGPGYLIRKLVVLTLVAIVIFFSFFMVDYRVVAPVVIEGAVQRVVAAPFDGYVKEAPVRPGDIVKEGELLCRLDDRELNLEHLRLSTEREQLSKQFQEAMANHERAQMRILKAKIDQTVARIFLIEEQLKRSQIAAPFDGLIVSGDLSQSLGAPVDRGQELFKIAPLDAYRVIAEVDERNIQDIKLEQHSELIMPSMPGEVFAFVIEKITPVSTAKEGRNYFRVEGRMEQSTTRLRPGMEGISKITIDRRKLIWVWTHELINWLRLQLWRWMP